MELRPPGSLTVPRGPSPAAHTPADPAPQHWGPWGWHPRRCPWGPTWLSWGTGLTRSHTRSYTPLRREGRGERGEAGYQVPCGLQPNQCQCPDQKPQFTCNVCVYVCMYEYIYIYKSINDKHIYMSYCTIIENTVQFVFTELPDMYYVILYNASYHNVQQYTK